MIAAEFRKEGYSFTPTQCENRWKYLRGKKKDNDSDSNTGGAYFDFEYYNEIDDILRNKPNVVPKYLASSSKMPSSSSSAASFASQSSSTKSKKRRQSTPRPPSPLSLDSSNVSALFSDADLSLAEEEEDLRRNASDSPAFGKTTKQKKEQERDENVKRQERFHNEMMQAQKDSTNVFKDVMFKMLEEYKKK